MTIRTRTRCSKLMIPTCIHCELLYVDSAVSYLLTRHNFRTDAMQAKLTECRTENAILKNSDGEIAQLERKLAQVKGQTLQYSKDAHDLRMQYFQPVDQEVDEEAQLYMEIQAEERAIRMIEMQTKLEADRISWYNVMQSSLEKELEVLTKLVDAKNATGK